MSSAGASWDPTVWDCTVDEMKQRSEAMCIFRNRAVLRFEHDIVDILYDDAKLSAMIYISYYGAVIIQCYFKAMKQIEALRGKTINNNDMHFLKCRDSEMKIHI